jgi:hypothetical protein
MSENSKLKGVISGLQKDIDVLHVKNVIQGWFTSLLIAVPCIILLLSPFEYQSIKIEYEPQWFMRLTYFMFAMLALLAPNQIPSTIQELVSALTTYLKNKTN